ncbi:hypothetical protein ACFLZN_00480 [Nanoarchaeota archaeon]
MKRLVLLLIPILLFAGCTFTGKVVDDKTTEKLVRLDMYVMSQCPYGVQAEEGFAPVAMEFADVLDYNIEYIGSYSGDNFQSLHGEPEWKGNMVQLCVKKHSPNKFVEFVSCMNKNPQAIPNNWEACSTELSLDTQLIKACYEGLEGIDLLKASNDASQAAGAQGSPTIKLDGADYMSGNYRLNNYQYILCYNQERLQIPLLLVQILLLLEHRMDIVTLRTCLI